MHRFPPDPNEINSHPEEHILAREASASLAFTDAPIGMVLLTPDGTLIEVNQAFVDMLGYSIKELLARDSSTYTHPDDVPVTREFFASLQRGPAKTTSIEKRYYKKDGTLVWTRASGTMRRDESGQPALVVAIVENITDRKNAEQELRRINRQLEEFAYVASHDLQEPLRMVNIYTELLTRRVADGEPEAQHYAEIISQGVKRMESLIRDLLIYSRTAQKEELPVGTANLSQSLTDALAALKVRIDETHAVVHVQALPTVKGDTKQLSHVFQNLISNALKYSKKGGAPEINISACEQDGLWVVEVRDNGIGFDPRFAEHIFGLFKRLHKEEIPGTGLGLAICQRIIERYGGRMWAEGVLDEGSAFYFGLLPA